MLQRPMRLFKNWHIPPKRVVLWHAISALPLAGVVGLGGYLSYHYHALSIEGREQVDRAYEVLEQVGALFVAVEAADVAQRDFLITGSPDRLAAFQAALHSIVARQGPLHVQLADSRPQLERLARLELAIAAKTTELGQTVTLRRTEGFEAVRAALTEHDTTQLTDRVSKEATGLVDAERALLLERQRTTRQHERHVLLAGVVIAALSVAIRLLVAWLLARLRKKSTAP